MENQTKIVSFFRFEDLRVYDKALDYFGWVAKQAEGVNEFDRKVILEPLAVAAAAVAQNIAEGSARHKPQFIQFLKDAKSAIRDCVVLTTLAHKNGVFTQEQFEQSHETLVEMTKMVGAMIVSLQKSAERTSQSAVSTGSADYMSDSDLSFEY